MQTVKYPLPTKTYVAGANDVISLRDMPKTLFGRIVHLVGITFDVLFTPTYSVTPPVAGMNNVVASMEVFDGSNVRFQGGFNILRAQERLHTGRIRIPDADTDLASASARYFRRTWRPGPRHFRGNPSDFAIPTALLETGEIRLRYGSLAELGGTVSALTATIVVTAHLALYDELRIPPCYTFTTQNATAADVPMTGKALYESVSLMDSSSFGDFTAGDLGNIRLDLGKGEVVQGIKGSSLAAAFADDFAPGELGGFAGDPGSANDDNNKRVNRGTPTAIAAGDMDLQPVLWAPPDSKISKLHDADSVARLRWDGSQSTAVVLVGRILPQPSAVVATLAAKALRAAGGLSHAGLKIKTLSKQPYSGPLTDYMPFTVKVA